MSQTPHFYRLLRTRQTLEYVDRMNTEYTHFGIPIEFWKAMSLLEPEDFIMSVYMVNAIRDDGYPRWFQFVGLLHALGKVMYIKGCDNDGTSTTHQWGILGETFILGCKLPDSCIYPHMNWGNPDLMNKFIDIELGIYTTNCGLTNCKMSWGHGEYLYHVVKNHTNRFPQAGLWCIRYQELYPWHTHSDYSHLTDSFDDMYLYWVRLLVGYKKTPIDGKITFDRDYCSSLVTEFLGPSLIYF